MGVIIWKAAMNRSTEVERTETSQTTITDMDFSSWSEEEMDTILNTIVSTELPVVASQNYSSYQPAMQKAILS